MPGLPGGLGLRTPLGEHRAPGASQEPRETLIKTYGDSGMPHEVLFEIGLVQMETGFTWSACIQPFVCDFSSSMQIVTPSRNLQSNLPAPTQLKTWPDSIVRQTDVVGSSLLARRLPTILSVKSL